MKAALKIIIGLVVAAGIGVGIYFAVDSTKDEATTTEPTTTEQATTDSPTTLDPSGYPPRPEPEPNQPYEWFWKDDEESLLEKYVYTDDGHFNWEIMEEKDWNNDTVPFF